MNDEARRLEDRTHEGDRRALAVGSGDMNDRRKLPFGMTERGQNPMDPIE